ncbi:MAG: alanyl-tRNA editing protein [Cuniculiplasma sp.]
MPTIHRYLEDAYRVEWEGKVTFNEFTDIIVDDSILYPTSYGQPNDKGKIIIDGKEFEIIDVWDDGDGVHLISHDTYPADSKGKTIKEVVDWSTRYNHMKFRTALRVLAGLAYKDFSAPHRINQTYEDYAWIDLEIDDISEEKVRQLENETNELLKGEVEVEYVSMSRDEFMKNSELMASIKGKVPDIPTLRVAKIKGLPEQLEMGTLVKNTKEVGQIKLKTNLIKGKVGTRVNLSLQ